MPYGRTKLCCCHINGCNHRTTVERLTGKSIQGVYLPLSTWSHHQKEQSVSNISRDQTEAQGAVDISPNQSGSSSETQYRQSGLSPESHIQLDIRQIPIIGSIETPTFESHNQIQKYRLSINNIIDSIETPSPPGLTYSFQPSLNFSFESFSHSTALLPDHPYFALVSGIPANEPLEIAKASLINMLNLLQNVETHNKTSLSGQIEELQVLITNGLSRIHSIKAIEWERQARKHVRQLEGESTGPTLVSTEQYIVAYSTLRKLSPTVILSLLLTIILHNVSGVSRDQSTFALAMLGCIDYFAWSTDKNQLKNPNYKLPKDIRTAEKLFNLPPTLLKYLSCPSCRKLFHPRNLDHARGLPTHCDNQEYPNAPSCGTPLWRKRYITGSPHFTPQLTFHVQDFHAWLGRFLSRPGMISLLRKPVDSVSKNLSSSFQRDIWDGRLIRSFKDSQGKRSFFQYTGPELRLLFGFGYDGFNPLHNKAAGKKGTVGAIFLFCYNLPPDIRFRPENVFLMGIIPGPKHPSLTQTNNYISPLIDTFLKFYNPGFLIWELPGYPEGLLTRGALWPVVMDSLAARQILGLAAITHQFFCFCCLIQGDDIDNVNPAGWKGWHSPLEHRRIAQSWQMSLTNAERETIFDKHGIRWSEFCRLPYFDVRKMTIVDPMHTFQNLCRNLVKDVWRIDSKEPSGDGLFVGSRPTPSNPVTNGECLEVLAAIHEGDNKTLDQFRRYPLWHLCERHELRRTGERVRPYRETLKTFYMNRPATLTQDIAYFRAQPQDATVGSRRILRKLRTALGSTSVDVREETQKLLESQLIDDLRLVCQERNVEYSVTQTRAELAEALLENQLETARPIASSDLIKGRAVLGQDILAEIDKDTARTILPSWVQPGPKTYDGVGHGKLSANEWRTHVVVRLVITLPRCWTNIDARHRAMLDNFMHLINAIVIASSRVITLSTANLYRSEYLSYLQGRLLLYPTGKIQPTEHNGYHIGDQLEEIGPCYITSTSALERFNGMLQNVNSNKRHNDLEGTMIKKFCTSGNLKTFMDSDFSGLIQARDREGLEAETRHHLQQIQHHFEKMLNIGTEPANMISESMDFSTARYFYPHKGDLQDSPQIDVGPELMKLLEAYFKRKSPSTILPTSAWPLSECQHYGTWFRKAIPRLTPLIPEHYLPPHRDSCIWFLSAATGGQTAGVIIDMFAFEPKSSISSNPAIRTYLIIRRYKELEKEDIPHDPWRKYPLSGGRLFYYETEPTPEIIEVDDVLAHVAITPFDEGEIDEINRSCIHILPLIWHNMFRPYDFPSSYNLET